MELSRCAWQTIKNLMQAAVGREDGQAAAVISLHMAGSLLKNFHPHAHSLVADGVLRTNGSFIRVPFLPTEALSELFRAKVLKMLVERADLEPQGREVLMSWDHQGGLQVWVGAPVYLPSIPSSQ